MKITIDVNPMKIFGLLVSTFFILSFFYTIIKMPNNQLVKDMSLMDLATFINMFSSFFLGCILLGITWHN